MNKRSLLSRLFISEIDGNVMWTGVAMANGLIIINLTFFRWYFTGVFEVSILEFVLGVTPFLILARPGQKALMNTKIGSFASRYLKKEDDAKVTTSAPKVATSASKVATSKPVKLQQVSGFPLTIDDLKCNDPARTPVPQEYRKNAELLLKNVAVIWEAAGRGRIRATSGYRTPAWNKSEGGSKTSRHMQAMAIDMMIDGLTKVQLRNLIGDLMDQGRITPGGYYSGNPKNFVHYDIGGVKQLIKR